MSISKIEAVLALPTLRNSDVAGIRWHLNQALAHQTALHIGAARQLAHNTESNYRTDREVGKILDDLWRDLLCTTDGHQTLRPS